MFNHLVDLTEPIYPKLDPDLASMTIFDTSGIEAWVTENNPRYDNRIIKQLKAFKKSHNLDDSCDSYKAAYGSMPTHAASNQAIQPMYINGHFATPINFRVFTCLQSHNQLSLRTCSKKSIVPDKKCQNCPDFTAVICLFIFMVVQEPKQFLCMEKFFCFFRGK